MEKTSQKGPTVLVALDFSPCSITALRRAKSIMGVKPAKILALHVIDQEFVARCVRNALGDQTEIKKSLFRVPLFEAVLNNRFQRGIQQTVDKRTGGVIGAGGLPLGPGRDIQFKG